MTPDEVKHVLSALKPLAYDAQKYKALTDYLSYKIQREHKVLEALTDPIQIHRSQGKIQAFRSLMSLRDEVVSSDTNQYG
jgi:hypothetical protein